MIRRFLRRLRRIRHYFLCRHKEKYVGLIPAPNVMLVKMCCTRCKLVTIGGQNVRRRGV